MGFDSIANEGDRRATASTNEVGRLLGRIKKLQAIVIQRLKLHKKKINLITYEGTIVDQLAYHFVSEVWNSNEYGIICSVRPCMNRQLISEVTSFASNNQYTLAGFEGDCSARYPWKKDVPRACENVSHHIYAYLKGSAGLFLSSGVFNSTTSSGFNKTNQEYQWLYTFEGDGLTSFTEKSDDRNWMTLFLFADFSLEDILITYLLFVSRELRDYHIPICYLNCYNESEQRKLVQLIAQIKESGYESLFA